ncbi:A24 family peptidase [Microbacterium panaciterrae]|uniref:Prepilin type IV endopeptidase peptidase domain-containing protein n=1 Tax=Microbacterium panaciterrae TaxID=985759 RepID=A0ABP8PJ41_9MICO
MDPFAVDLHAMLVALTHLALLGIGVWLIVIDIGSHRLPDRIVLPTLAGAIALVLVEAAVTGDGGPSAGALWGMLLLGGFYAILRLLSRGGLGGGDVKLAAVIGLILGWHGGQALIVGAAAAFVLGAVHALALIVLRRADRRSHIAFGPWMILGGVLGIAAA